MLQSNCTESVQRLLQELQGCFHSHLFEVLVSKAETLAPEIRLVRAHVSAQQITKYG